MTNGQVKDKKHLLRLCPTANIEIFPGMNHGQLLVDNPEMIMMKIEKMLG